MEVIQEVAGTVIFLTTIAFTLGIVLGYLMWNRWWPKVVTEVLEKTQIKTVYKDKIVYRTPKEKIVEVTKPSVVFGVDNKTHEFGSAQAYLGLDVLRSGTDKSTTRYMFTKTELKNAFNRANKNKEEVPSGFKKKAAPKKTTPKKG